MTKEGGGSLVFNLVTIFPEWPNLYRVIFWVYRQSCLCYEAKPVDLLAPVTFCYVSVCDFVLTPPLFLCGCCDRRYQNFLSDACLGKSQSWTNYKALALYSDPFFLKTLLKPIKLPVRQSLDLLYIPLTLLELSIRWVIHAVVFVYCHEERRPYYFETWEKILYKSNCISQNIYFVKLSESL